MDELMKIAALSLAGVLLAQLIKKDTPSIALLLTTTVAAGIMIFIVSAIGQLRVFIDYIAELSHLSAELVTPVLKTVGVSLLSKMIASLCRDGGETAVAAGVETAGNVVALLFLLPLLNAVFELCLRLL